MKNENVSHQDKYFEIVFTFVKVIHREVNSLAALSFISLDCKLEVYDKVYSNYGFKLLNGTNEYYACGLNVYR